MADVRGKFTVTSIKRSSWNPKAAEVELQARYSNNPEDQTYSEATPSAHITMHITNEAAIDKLPLGKAFYVDFTAVPEATDQVSA